MGNIVKFPGLCPDNPLLKRQNCYDGS